MKLHSGQHSYREGKCTPAIFTVFINQLRVVGRITFSWKTEHLHILNIFMLTIDLQACYTCLESILSPLFTSIKQCPIGFNCSLVNKSFLRVKTSPHTPKSNENHALSTCGWPAHRFFICKATVWGGNCWDCSQTFRATQKRFVASAHSARIRRHPWA